MRFDSTRGLSSNGGLSFEKSEAEHHKKKARRAKAKIKIPSSSSPVVVVVVVRVVRVIECCRVRTVVTVGKDVF